MQRSFYVRDSWPYAGPWYCRRGVTVSSKPFYPIQRSIYVRKSELYAGGPLHIVDATISFIRNMICGNRVFLVGNHHSLVKSRSVCMTYIIIFEKNLLKSRFSIACLLHNNVVLKISFNLNFKYLKLNSILL